MVFDKKKMKRKIYYVLLILFLLNSFLFISSPSKKMRSTFHSSQLNMITIRDGDRERTEYVDENGKITVAADLGYAIIVTTKTEHSLLEKYYDDKGKPINRYDGYYAVLREYDEKDNNIRNTYLDAQGNPFITLSGYAIQEREYSLNGKLIAIRYYDDKHNPVSTVSECYGKIYERNENGETNTITYIDDSGAPMLTKQGYAIVKRNYYSSDSSENGKVESEFYFDEVGNPVSLSLGQYGIHKEYDDNGRESVLTYLDAEGNLIVTTKGYTTVLRTFQANNSVATERYFDIEGKPFSLSEGQYGIKIDNGQITYLNQDGKTIFNLRNLLYNHSWIVILVSIAIITLSQANPRRWNYILACLYTLAIIYLTLMFRENEGTKYTELFGYYKRIFESSEARADIIKNIWLFIPLGAILYQLCTKKSIIFIAVILSVLIEITQLITGIGFCELDDIISNSLGGFIGFYAGKLTTNLLERINRRKQIHSV